MDLIDRKAAIEAIVNTATDVYSHDRIVSVLDGAAFRQNEIIDIINALPSAQPEIVRCKDCRYVWNENGWDNLWCNRLTRSFSVEKDGGCSWGKI